MGVISDSPGIHALVIKAAILWNYATHNSPYCHRQRVPAIVAAFNDNNVSFVVRGGLQVLVLLADPNAGTISVTDTVVSPLKCLNGNCMSLVYFQGLGLIANDTTASAADTGAFTNHNSQL